MNEGGTAKLPCRAQGRPKVRIVWDRIGGNLNQHTMEQIQQSFDNEDVQEELLSKAKIMSLRLKRGVSDLTVLHDSDTYKKDYHVENKLNQIGNTNDSITKIHNKRDTGDDVINFNNYENAEISSTVISNFSDTIPIISLSTQSPQEASHLEVNEQGELILKEVTKKDQGWYACAALNEAGSIIKRVFIRVFSKDDGENVDLSNDPTNIRFTNEQNIIINNVLAILPNALDVTWETNDGIPATTLTLHYRILGSKEFQTTTALIDAREYSIAGLKAHTEYEVFASVPHGLIGSVSNIRKGRTLDGPPTSPPVDVRVGIINTTAAYVRWSPPPTNFLNGDLTGYKV